MTSNTHSLLMRLPLLWLVAMVALGIWQPWVSLGNAAGFTGVQSVCPPLALVALIGLSFRVTTSRTTACRGRAAAFYVLLAALIVAAAGVVYALVVDPESSRPAWWFIALVVTVPVASLVAGVAVYRLAQPRHPES